MSLGAEHPLRRELHQELHARPSLYFDGDTDVWHVAFVSENPAPHIPSELLELDDVTVTAQGSHGIGNVATGG